jgi:hypothetical protein
MVRNHDPPFAVKSLGKNRINRSFTINFYRAIGARRFPRHAQAFEGYPRENDEQDSDFGAGSGGSVEWPVLRDRQGARGSAGVDVTAGVRLGRGTASELPCGGRRLWQRRLHAGIDQSNAPPQIKMAGSRLSRRLTDKSL